MSTKLTTSPRGGYPLAESRALRLTRGAAGFRDRLVDWLVARLHGDGFAALTPKHLAFMGELDCGTNHAAELARRLGISRQAVHKSVQELDALGWLETLPHPEIGNQKTIAFTREGERIMSRARAHFADLDRILLARFGPEALDAAEALLTDQLPETP